MPSVRLNKHALDERRNERRRRKAWGRGVDDAACASLSGTDSALHERKEGVRCSGRHAGRCRGEARVPEELGD